MIHIHHNVLLIVLGEFEYLVLSAAARLEETAYGASIRRELEAVAERRCSTGALYTTLDRLEAKGLVETRVGGATLERGGRAKRLVRLTPLGIRAASEFYRTILLSSRGVAWAARPTEVGL